MRVKGKESPGCAIAFGLGWTLFSLVLVWLGIQSASKGVEESSWPEVPCEMLEFRVDASESAEPPFQPKARYRYQWEGQVYQSDQVWRGKEGEDDYRFMAVLEEQYRKGLLRACHVNPKNPSEAILFMQKSKIAIGLVLLIFGGLSTLLGMGVFISAFKAKAANRRSLSSGALPPNKKAAGRVIGYGLSLTLVIGGGVLFWHMGVKKWLAVKDAEQWAEAPATVIWSRVISHDSDDGTTYSTDIFYRYQYQGVEYRSDRFNFALKGSSSGYEGKRKIVDRYPRRHQFTCYCNPQKPWEAVIEKKAGKLGSVFAVVIPLMMVGGGIAWLRLLLFGKNRSKNSSAGQSLAVTGDAKQTGELVLKVGKKRAGWFLGSLVLALFWNGIVSILVLDVMKGWEKGSPSWFLTLFSIPFVLVGIVLIGHVFSRLMALFNPRPELRLSAEDLVLGRKLEVEWEMPSASARVKKWAIFLVGMEKATYRRGTDSVTVEEMFFEGELVSTKSPREMMRGQGSIEIPADLVPSWKAKNNEILWKIVQHGEIDKWPDIKEEHRVEVRTETL